MAKKSITNQSIFGHYKSEENMVTAALLHILKLGGEELINIITRQSIYGKATGKHIVFAK